MAAFSLILLFAFFLPLFPFIKGCPSVPCGRLGMLNFPFTDTFGFDEGCGPFVVDHCKGKEIPKIQFDWRPGKWYQVESIFPIEENGIQLSTNISVTDIELQNQLNSRKCESFNNLSLPNLTYASFQIDSSLTTIYKCNHSVDFPEPSFNFISYTECPNFKFYYPKKDNASIPRPQPNCSIVQLPLNTNNDHDDIFRMLAANFSLNVSIRLDCYHCHLRGGECKTNNGTVKCIGGPQPLPPPERHKALSASGIALLVIVFCFCRKLSSKYSIFYWKKNTQCHQSIEAFLKNNGVMSPKRYKYTEVKKMTGSFNDKLGQGGYGSVFKGKLPDGRLVAVKILKESKSNGEEFINEVASISRTSHVNIVALLGFCFKGSKRALIYEFMFNGSLERYIYEENPLKADRQLDWETLHQIALGIARGLEYLHRGCNTRILHFDIKPHNILLDETFCPKISDFGLAKICPRKESIISLMDARGTAGYIAPEVFCRNFGVVSHKSDVYSYGMLVLEMVGGRKNICVAVDNTSEIYFPHWIFKRLELGEELELNGIDSEEDHLTSKKMALVSLWCIQTDPSNRPPISRVVEMLQERLESLPIPPKPYLSSPSRSSLRSTASSLISQQ
ncbi:hypothetical protein P3X46_031386 [Hevea brasiliensis]|uniref:Protein kinase domain-containing protein n=1 Tax=Hevea brasiliensis TaxID=3981 RepID=A0ABQ9KL55_HEVBR|nr:hypothetical protein P3X46_031386 [Hevea brasiliensis]